MENKEKMLLTLDEAARLLAVSPRTVRRLIDQGIYKPIRVGNLLTLHLTELPFDASPLAMDTGIRPLMTIHEVAATLQCSPRDVRDMTARGELTMIEVGGSKRWLATNVDALAEWSSCHG